MKLLTIRDIRAGEMLLSSGLELIDAVNNEDEAALFYVLMSGETKWITAVFSGISSFDELRNNCKQVLIRKAQAEAGHDLAAQYNLALLANGDEKQRLKEITKERATQSAENGDPIANYILGYYDMQSFDNRLIVGDCMYKSAETGFLPAIYEAAGMGKDMATRKYWYEKLCELGCPIGMYEYSNFDSENPNIDMHERYSRRHRAAERGNIHAMQDIYFSVYHGLNGFARNKDYAIKLLQKLILRDPENERYISQLNEWSAKTPAAPVVVEQTNFLCKLKSIFGVRG